MAGSSFGTLFRVTTWGESHGAGLGVVVDGCPAGLELSEEDIQRYLDRRKPGQNRYTTKRSESDTVRILSGVFEGRTTGTPISLIVMNADQHSKDYGNLREMYRPGHADLCFDSKFGIRDHRGGGRSSGRETVGRVAAGAIAAKVLEDLGIRVRAWTASVGPVSCDPEKFDEEHLAKSALVMPDPEAERKAAEYLEGCMADRDSSGGTVECIVSGMPAGIGEPVFDKLDALLGQAIFSIGAVKGVEIGDGFLAARSRGSKNNDQYIAVRNVPDTDVEGTAGLTAEDASDADSEGALSMMGDDDSGTDAKSVSGMEAEDGCGRNALCGRDMKEECRDIRAVKLTNHAGGILGGMSDGSSIRIRAAFKPTPSIRGPQSVLGTDGKVHELEIKGRHDPLIAPRAAVVVECMTAIVLLDLVMRNMSSRMENLRRIYAPEEC